MSKAKRVSTKVTERCNKAAVVLEDALNKLTERLGPKDDLTVDCQFEFARVLSERREYKKAERLIKECIDYWRKSIEISSIADHNYFDAKIHWAECHLQHMFREWKVLKISANMDPTTPREQIKYTKDPREETKDGYLANKEDLYNHEENEDEEDGTVLV